MLQKALQLCGYVLMGLWSILLLGVLLWDIGRLLLYGADQVALLAGKPALSSLLLPADAARRGQLAHIVRLVLVSGSVLICAWGYVQAVLPPRVRTVDIPVRNLPEALHGTRIVQLTDLHLTARTSADETRGLVDQVNSLEPDLVVVTGDLADGTTSALRDAVTPLGGLSAPLGTWFVTGNHEYYSGVEGWLAMTTSLGWRNLLNEHVLLDRGGATVLLAGVTDTSVSLPAAPHRSDPKAAILGAPEADARILLAHQPKSAATAVEQDLGFDLVLSGHTHGGQFFPWCLVVPLVQPYASGYFREGRTHIYTSPGTGYWGPPNRAGVPAEITLLRLVPGT
ncbi:MAG: metallophosphoesterase [Deltaproteobacteria bacterium]|nr:metallophosphoesterase [Deltaproteobacteria bacterium]